MDKNLMINANQATLDAPNAPNEMHEFDLYSVYDHPDAKILLILLVIQMLWERMADINKKPFHFADESCHLPNRLEQIGVDPKKLICSCSHHI